MPSLRVLDSLFFPKSVAVVGASTKPGITDHDFLSFLQKRGYPGRLYPVNPKATEIAGLKCYPNIKLIPEPPDHVIIAIPARGVPQVLRDCVTRGVKNVHIFAGGFAETGEAEGKKLDEEIAEIIREGDLRVVGPNCMGIWVPASKLVAWGPEPKGIGSLAFVSQSGGHGELLTESAQDLGIYFSKVISFGNAKGLQAVDFLEYLEADPDTKMIACYFEGMVDGNQLTKLIKRINRVKPVFVWKGGLTLTGARTAYYHTGSSGGDPKAWEAFFTETGAVPVNSLEEIIDVAMVFQNLNSNTGKRVLLIGSGGGNAVLFADICSREGLDVPPINEHTRQELNKFIPLAGSSMRNPIDTWFGLEDEDVDLLKKILDITLADPNIDMVILEKMIWEPSMDPQLAEQSRKMDEFRLEYCKHNSSGKPIAIVSTTMSSLEKLVSYRARLLMKYALEGVPTFQSKVNAARALSRFITYHKYKALAKGRIESTKETAETG